MPSPTYQQYSTTATLAAGDVIRLCPAMTDQAEVFIIPLANASETNITAQRAVCALNSPCILSSGDTIGVIVPHFVSAGTIDVICNIRFARMT